MGLANSHAKFFGVHFNLHGAIREIKADALINLKLGAGLYGEKDWLGAVCLYPALTRCLVVVRNKTVHDFS
jgi:hypothetical protein